MIYTAKITGHDYDSTKTLQFTMDIDAPSETVARNRIWKKIDCGEYREYALFVGAITLK